MMVMQLGDDQFLLVAIAEEYLWHCRIPAVLVPTLGTCRCRSSQYPPAWKTLLTKIKNGQAMQSRGS
jgi:hypothetical protein